MACPNLWLRAHQALGLLGFRVKGLGFKGCGVWGLEGLEGLGLRVYGLWGVGFRVYRVWSLGFMVYRVWGLGFRVWGLGFMVQDLGFRAWKCLEFTV